jgi:hypothetical protein
MGYAGAMNSAFEFLGKANKMLKKRGRGNNDLEHALLECFGDAAAMAAALTETVLLPLGSCRATLAACQKDVQQASLAATDMEKKSSKLKSLTKKKRADEGKVKIAREQLQQAMQASSVSRTRADDALRGCMLREPEICNLALKLMKGTSELLHCAVWPLEPPTPRPDDDPNEKMEHTAGIETAEAMEDAVSRASSEGDLAARAAAEEVIMETTLRPPPAESTSPAARSPAIGDGEDSNPFCRDDTDLVQEASAPEETPGALREARAPVETLGVATCETDNP